MLSKEAAQTWKENATGKLQRAITAILRHYAVNGFIGPDIQHAIRILQSRVRLISRLYNLQFGTDLEQQVASLELCVNDIGDILEIHGAKHGRGRFDCKACVRPNLLVNPPLCQNCKCGVLHITLVRDTIDPEGSQRDSNRHYNGPRLLYMCDCCSKTTEEKVEL